MTSDRLQPGCCRHTYNCDQKNLLVLLASTARDGQSGLWVFIMLSQTADFSPATTARSITEAQLSPGYLLSAVSPFLSLVALCFQVVVELNNVLIVSGGDNTSGYCLREG